MAKSVLCKVILSIIASGIFNVAITSCLPSVGIISPRQLQLHQQRQQWLPTHAISEPDYLQTQHYWAPFDGNDFIYMGKRDPSKGTIVGFSNEVELDGTSVRDIRSPLGTMRFGKRTRTGNPLGTMRFGRK